MDGKIKKSLIEKQDVLDHMSKALGLMIAINVVPTHSAQTCLERLLHAAQLFRIEKIRQDNNTVRLELRGKRINF